MPPTTSRAGKPAVPPVFSVRRWGAENGDGLVLDISNDDGPAVYGIGVEPPEGASHANGPTWAYIVMEEGLTLIDPGHMGSFGYLSDGMQALGLDPSDIDRVVVTHGHWDHDGGVAELVEASGAEFWAHELWQAYAPFSYSRLLRSDNSPLRAAMKRLGERLESSVRIKGGSETRGPGGGQREYYTMRANLRVDRALADGDRIGALEFFHTPGHWPDELTMRLGDLIITGDHVLPEITPHPSMAYDHPEELVNELPDRYREAREVWGLGAYLRSLRRAADLGAGMTVLPAHRLFNHDEFRMTDERRALETIVFHGDRCDLLADAVATGHNSLESATRELFSYRPLRDTYQFISAVSETISHIELLQDTGDMEVRPVEDGDGVRLELTGSRNYRDVIGDLAPAGGFPE